MEARTAELEALFERSGWVRRLARSLVGEAQAADLVQEAWIAAHARERLSGSSLRRFVSAVVHNLARRHWRGESRRTVRERAVAKPPADRGELHTREDLEVHEALLAAVRSLGEPYRTAIHLRYFQELSPRDIAERNHVPVRTVHTRLARALELLREKLDRRHRGDRSAWMAMLVPLAKSSSAPLLGGLIVETKLKLALAAAAVAAAGTWYAVETRDAAPVELAAAAPRVETLDLERPAQELARSQANEPARSAPPALDLAPAAAAPPPPVPTHVRAVVIDLQGAPVGGVTVVLHAGHGEGEREAGREVSAADGSLVLPYTLETGRWELVGGPWSIVLEPFMPLRAGEGELVLVVAPRAPLEGVVVDPAGEPLAGARVKIAHSADLRASIQRVLDMSRQVLWETHSDANGHFVLEDAPAIAKSVIEVELAGYELRHVEPPLAEKRDLRLVLEPFTDPDLGLRGTVVDQDSAPVEGAHVALGTASTRTDASGSFVIDLRRAYEDQVDGARVSPTGEAPPPGILRAVVRDHMPGTLECPGDSPMERSSWPDPLVLRIGARALAITGRVLDGAQRPIAGAEIELMDRESFGLVPFSTGAMTLHANTQVESLIAGQQFMPNQHADSDGRFTIGGLQDRCYRLRIHDPRTLRYSISAPIAAGADVDLALPSEPMRELVSGVVVGRNGKPVQMAAVYVMRRFGGGDQPEVELEGENVHTDAEGRFALRDVARAASTLRVRVPGSPQSTDVALGDEARTTDLRIVVPLQCHLQIDLSDSGIEADGFTILDAQGKQLHLLVTYGDLSLSTESWRLEGGKCEAISIVDSAETLVLHRTEHVADTITREVEVARIPLRLQAGELNVIKP